LDVSGTLDDPADGWFGESVADTYDAGVGIEFDSDEIERTVGVLAELAGDGAALELAIGTGRIALRWLDGASRCTGSSSAGPWRRASPRGPGAAPSP
jgi:hypothetical protein